VLLGDRDHRASALTVSFAFHLALFAALAVGMRSTSKVAPPVDLHDRPSARLVWLDASGPGGGGGGGGKRMKDPPSRVELPGHDAITVPAAKPRVFDPSRPVDIERETVPRLEIPVATLASATAALPQVGSIDAPSTASRISQGPGDGGGAGTGKGPGDGPGDGSGLRDGHDRGTGGDVFAPGNGVTMPIEIQKGTPRYTSEAMRAKVQGSIMVECVVQISGTCTNIRVRRSFDPAFGLDQEAIKAAAQWRFRPGTRLGQPVPVIVTMEIAFALR